jgi:dTMP kinase
VLRTREPGGSPGAERLRELLLSGDASFAPQAEALLHFAARADHVARTIRPALEAGLWVICDRFSDSTMAYQGHGQGAPLETIATLAGLVGLVPDLTLVLDVSEPVAAARVRAGFRAIASAEPARCRLIAADGTEAEVHGHIMAAIGERFGPA